MGHKSDWPANPAIYQVYPRSFLDTTGTGEGDLRGVIEKMGYIAELGVDALWLSPFFVSPMVDGGYDVADHSAVDPRFGTMDDFEELVAAAHDAGLKVLIDQVLNHTSDQHPLFLAAVEGDESAAECYLWQDPKEDGSLPNNWLSQFGPPAWTWNHKRRQYYFHQFLAAQPSLNLRNERVQEMHHQEIRFWRDKGVDGFRFDAVTSYLFDESLKDNPPSSPEVHEKMVTFRFVPYSYQDHVYDMLPGDGAAYAENLRKWAGEDAWLLGESTSGNNSLKLVKDFTEEGRLDAMYTVDMPEEGADPEMLGRLFDEVSDLSRYGKWMSSHDQPRHISVRGDGSDRDARFFSMMMAVLPGPWMIYQGEELGLPQPRLSREESVDPVDLIFWPDGPGRDGARVPVPWGEGPAFGFSEGSPWLPMRWESDRAVSAQTEESTLGFYRRALAARKEHGWPEGTVTGHKTKGEVMTIDLDVDGRAWRAVFNYGTDTVSPGLGAPFMASQHCVGDMLGRTAAIWKL
ncbi:alpha-amylase family glycosyl hydrolase [Roseobacter sp.]|uniref:alpha-amylase family glycosyl hydrolase n=1 Tax=Roseobacter sp. TaxID=1907202 RepID=UPI0025CCCD77|nr:alpha-amylase family glycosyl hydrolase [Roseobacter sp.]